MINTLKNSETPNILKNNVTGDLVTKPMMVIKTYEAKVTSGKIRSLKYFKHK